jgi:hypothetical protein
MPFFEDTMEIENVEEWIPVQGRRRSKSPPKQTDGIKTQIQEAVSASYAPGFNLPPEELPSNYRPLGQPNTANHPKEQPNMKETKQLLTSSWQTLPPVTKSIK